MEKVVGIFKERKPDPLVFACGNCDSQHFYIEDSGELTCRECSQIQPFRWYDPSEESNEHKPT